MISLVSISRAIVLVTVCASTANASCDSVPKNLIKDGAWLVQAQDGLKLVDDNFDPFGSDRQPRLLNFTYVVDDLLDNKPRKGILLVKTGQRADTLGRADKEAFVRLFKKPMKADSCGDEKSRFVRVVPAADYDKYHDKADFRVADPSIGSFHIRYPARVGCRDSNNTTDDADYTLRTTNNLAQFSFDPEIVKYGQPGTLSLVRLLFTPAYAAVNLTQRRVEMMKYTGDEQGLACVRFKLVVRPGTTIYLNDVERRFRFRQNQKAWVAKQ